MSQYVSFRQLTYRGAWRTDAPYRPGDFVTYSEGLYVCLQPNLGQLPTDTDYWDKLSQPAGTGPPSAHASTHQNGGGDEVATETPAAYAIPKAGAGGKLSNSWLNTGTGNSLDADTVDGSHASAFQPVDDELTAIAGLTSAADLGIYFTGSGAAATFTLTAAARTLLAAATAADQRSALGLIIGTNVQAQNPNLQAIADLTTAADKLNYWTGSGTTALTDLTSFARTFLDDANAAAVRTTLGLETSETSVVWVSKIGSDSNSGLLRHLPKLTITSAITAAAALVTARAPRAIV